MSTEPCLSSNVWCSKKQHQEEEEEMQRNMERLELIKKKREEDRLKRIAEEGWDRFAPISETNKRPEHIPNGYPGGAREDAD
eukprot:jgi/Botrbrau1/15329/Bobra.0379s0002.1